MTGFKLIGPYFASHAAIKDGPERGETENRSRAVPACPAGRFGVQLTSLEIAGGEAGVRLAEVALPWIV